MRILITSISHPHYNQTGTVVRDLRQEGLLVRLDRSNEEVLVPEGQWKILKLQEALR